MPPISSKIVFAIVCYLHILFYFECPQNPSYIFGTVICLLASGQLMGLFTTTPETIAAGSRALKIISAGFLVSAVSVTTSGAMEGLGKGTQSLVISLFRYVVVIMPTAYLLSHFMGPDGVWNAFWITEVFTAIVSVMIYHKTLKKA